MESACTFGAGAVLALCAAAAVTAAAGPARAAAAAARNVPETFIIRANSGGREATIKVPVGAVSAFSASRAEALNGYAGPDIEAMRLSGDVRIELIGAGEPIEIKADRVVLELTADDAAARKAAGPVRESRSLRSSRVIGDERSGQTFLGDVVFTMQTRSGAMQITADRLDHSVPMARARRPEGV